MTIEYDIEIWHPLLYIFEIINLIILSEYYLIYLAKVGIYFKIKNFYHLFLIL